jgi:hypothetical protein
VLVVSDTGTGMSDAVLARLFEPFFTTKEPGRGTGLGLATVYGAIDGAGGSVTVRSEPGAGAVFEIRLPLADRAQPPPDEERASPRPAAGSGEVAGARPVVLIVDDEPAIRQLATRLLERAEFDVLVADGGAEAVRLVLDPSVRIDLVLTDLVMPGVTGTEVAMAARAHRPHAGVLFMSGFVAADVLTSLDAPVVPKPFTADDLIDAVSTSLGRGNAATRPDPE